MKKLIFIPLVLLSVCLSSCEYSPEATSQEPEYIIPKSVEELGVSYPYVHRVNLFMDETYDLRNSFDFSKSSLTIDDFEVKIDNAWSDEIVVSVSDDYIVTPLKIGNSRVTIDYEDENGTKYEGVQVFTVTSWVNRYYFTRETTLYPNTEVRTMAKLYLNEDMSFIFSTWEDWGSHSRVLYNVEGTWRKEFPAYLALTFDQITSNSMELIPLTQENLEFREDMDWFFGPKEMRKSDYFAVFGNPYLGNVEGPTIIVISTTGGGYMHQTRLLTTKEYVTHWSMTGDEW